MIPLLRRLWDRLRREHMAADLDRELAFHRAMLERDYRAQGMAPAEAAHAARREMGNRTSIREESRDMWSFRRIEDASQDLRYGVRVLRRSPIYAVVATLTLALGIGATAAIFTVVNGVLLKPLPFGNPEQLIGAWHDLPLLHATHVQQTAGTYFTYQRLAKTIDGIGVYQTAAVNVSDPGGQGEAQRITSAWVSSTLFPVLQVPPLRGRSFTEAEDRPNGPNAIIISEGMWRSRFGAAENVIGRSLDIGGVARPIVGVMPGSFRFPEAGTELWLPLGLDPNAQNPGGFNYNSIARLKPGVTVADAEREFIALLPRMVDLYPNFAPGVTTQMVLDQTHVRPLLVPLRHDITGGISGALWMVAAAAALVLLVAGANVTNLVLVRLDGRQRELALRESLGASRIRVTMQLFAESAVLAGFAAVIGLALAWLAVRALVAFGPADIPRLVELAVDGTTVAFALAMAAISAIACSIIPSVRLGRADLSRSLREGGRSGTASRVQHRVRATLVAAQMALALVALVSSGLLVRTFQHLNAIKPGFDAGHVITMWVSASRGHYPTDTSVVRFFAALTDRVAKLQGVEAVGLTSRVPLETRGLNSNPYYPENDPSYATKIPPLQIFTTVNSDYFRAMGIPIVAGKTFDPPATQRGDQVVISRRTAQTFYGDSSGAAALGRRFRDLPNGVWYTVIGVAGDVRDTSLAAAPDQAVYFPEVLPASTVSGQMQRTMALAVRVSGDPAAAARRVQEAVHDTDSSLPTFDVKPMTSVLRASMAQLTFVLLMLGAAAAVTLVLGAIGLYGVMAYVVTLRTREFGVRIALGARPGSVAGMLARQGLVLAIVGGVGGLAVFSVVARFLRSFLFGVAPGDPVTLAAASVTLVAIAMLASWIPARRASRIDPAETLRTD